MTLRLPLPPDALRTVRDFASDRIGTHPTAAIIKAVSVRHIPKTEAWENEILEFHAAPPAFFRTRGLFHRRRLLAKQSIRVLIKELTESFWSEYADTFQYRPFDAEYYEDPFADDANMEGLVASILKRDCPEYYDPSADNANMETLVHKTE